MVAAGVRLKKLFFTPDELTLTKFRSANEQVPASQKQLAVFQPFFFRGSRNFRWIFSPGYHFLKLGKRNALDRLDTTTKTTAQGIRLLLVM